MPQIIIGCDLSRDRIDLHCLPEERFSQIANAKPDIAAWADSLDPSTVIVFEATSGCDGLLIAILAERGIAHARVNPRQAREFARARKRRSSLGVGRARRSARRRPGPGE